MVPAAMGMPMMVSVSPALSLGMSMVMSPALPPVLPPVLSVVLSLGRSMIMRVGMRVVWGPRMGAAAGRGRRGMFISYHGIGLWHRALSRSHANRRRMSSPRLCHGVSVIPRRSG